MSKLDTFPDSLSITQYAPFELREPMPNMSRGWGKSETMFRDEALLRALHQEALIARATARNRGDKLSSVNPGSRGLEIVRLRPDELPDYPGLASVVDRLELELGGMNVMAQFNYYEPGGYIAGHRDGPSFSADTAVVIGVDGDGKFKISADADLGYSDEEVFDLRPGGAVMLPPIRAGGFTTRTHAAINTDTIERVSIVAAFR